MWPALIPGAKYCASILLRPKVGRIAVAQINENLIVVKKISSIQNEQVILVSINPLGENYKVAKVQILGCLIRP